MPDSTEDFDPQGKYQVVAIPSGLHSEKDEVVVIQTSDKTEAMHRIENLNSNGLGAELHLTFFPDEDVKVFPAKE